MIDLKEFRKINNIKQSDLAIFLGTSRVFISLVENGGSKLPADKLRMLLNNDRGWDTSALTELPGEVNTPRNKANSVVNPNDNSETALKLALLEQENAQLKERLKDKDEEIAFLKSLLKR